jgi:hypothetical protein
MRERPVSVTIFGILNIGFGLLGLCSALLSLLFGGSNFPAAMPSLGPYFSNVLMVWNAIVTDPAYVVWSRIAGPLDVTASLALIAAGIGLLLLQNWSRLVSIGYAIYCMVSAVLNLAVIFVVLHRLLANALPASARGQLAIMVVAVMGAVLTLVYPALLLFFLTRPGAVLACRPESASPL